MHPFKFLKTAILAGMASIFLAVAASGAESWERASMKVEEMRLKAKVEDLRAKVAVENERAKRLDKNNDLRALAAEAVANDYEKQLKRQEKELKSVQRKLNPTIWGAMKAPAKRAERQVATSVNPNWQSEREMDRVLKARDAADRAEREREHQALKRAIARKEAAAEAAKEAAKRAAQDAARDATRTASIAAAKEAAASAAKNASKVASKSSSKSASQDAAKTAISHPSPAPGGMHCFIAGTLVHTPTGCRKIETLKIGDEVLSFNERTGRIEPGPVLRTWKSQRADLIRLGTHEGSVTCSQNHRFYTADQRWLAANRIKPGEMVMKRDPTHPDRVIAAPACTVTALKLKSPVNVFNLTVARNSDYFVGPAAALCHNVK